MTRGTLTQHLIEVDTLGQTILSTHSNCLAMTDKSEKQDRKCVNRRKFLLQTAVATSAGGLISTGVTPDIQSPVQRVSGEHFEDVDPEDFTDDQRQAYNILQNGEDHLNNLFEPVERGFSRSYSLIQQGQTIDLLGTSDSTPADVTTKISDATDLLSDNPTTPQSKYLHAYRDGLQEGLFMLAETEEVRRRLNNAQVHYKDWEQALESFDFTEAQNTYQKYVIEVSEATTHLSNLISWWKNSLQYHIYPFDLFTEIRINALIGDVSNLHKLYEMLTKIEETKLPHDEGETIQISPGKAVKKAVEHVYKAGLCLFGDDFKQPDSSGFPNYNCLKDAGFTQTEIDNMSDEQRREAETSHAVENLSSAAGYFTVSHNTIGLRLPEDQPALRQDVYKLQCVYNAYSKMAKELKQPTWENFRGEPPAVVSQSANQAIRPLKNCNYPFFKQGFNMFLDEFIQYEEFTPEDPDEIRETENVDPQKSEEFLTNEHIADHRYGINIITRTQEGIAVENIRVRFIDPEFDTEVVETTDEYGVASRVFAGPREEPTDSGEPNTSATINVVTGERTDIYRTDELEELTDPNDNGKSNKGTAEIPKGQSKTYHFIRAENSQNNR